jgi:type II secretory pathway predicted ATPase ExeA
MQRPGYERFALISNPFHDLSSEALEEIELYHVCQESDDAFEGLKQEVLERQRKAFLFIVGPLGAGKTQRLRVTEAQARRVGAFAHFMNLGEAPPDPMAAIAATAVAEADHRKLAKVLSSPRWHRELSALAKGKPLNPETAGRSLAEALNALAPAYLLLNDLDALAQPLEDGILQVLLATVSHLQPGVMVAIACPPDHFHDLGARHPALMSRVNRVLELRPLRSEDAHLILAKRLAGRRLVEDLDPVYPFTPESVAELNRAAQGSPRRLLQLSDLVLEQAVRDRAFQVGPDVVHSALARAGPLAAGAQNGQPTPGSGEVVPTAATVMEIPPIPTSKGTRAKRSVSAPLRKKTAAPAEPLLLQPAILVGPDSPPAEPPAAAPTPESDPAFPSPVLGSQPPVAAKQLPPVVAKRSVEDASSRLARLLRPNGHTRTR